MENITLYTTGFGPEVGGSDIWTNHFLRKVAPSMQENNNVEIIVDGSYNRKHKDIYDSFGIKYNFMSLSYDISNQKLKLSDKIIVLNMHLHGESILHKHLDKIHSVVCHVYTKDIINWSMMDDEDFFPYTFSYHAQKKVLDAAEKIVWVGTPKNTWLIKDYDNAECVPNFYTFKKDKDFNFTNELIGYAARMEGRKMPHLLNEVPSVAFTKVDSVPQLKKNTGEEFEDTRWISFDPDWTEFFYDKERWGIYHGASKYEPFGYGIFMAVDYGRIPILDSTWFIPNLDYKYIVSEDKSFKEVYEQILNDSMDVRKKEFNKLKKRLKKYDWADTWSEKLKEVINV